MSQNQQQNKQQGQQQNKQMKASGNTGMYNVNDAMLCEDLLLTEKYVSSTYDTTIFECQNTQVRDALNHIQKEEQQHGEGIFNLDLSQYFGQKFRFFCGSPPPLTIQT